MTNTGPGNRDDHEAAIEALIDGELDEAGVASLNAAAAGDPLVARALADAWRIRTALDRLQLERAPVGLSRRLRRIPAEQRRAGGWNPWPRRIAAGAFASVVLVAFAMMMTARSPGPGPEPAAGAELARIEDARRELAIAFRYLDRIGARAGERLEHVLYDEVAAPVTESLSRHMPYTESSRTEEKS